MRRDMVATTPHAAGMWTFYHPEAQEVLLAAAADAGAEVRRGAVVSAIAPGKRPQTTIDGQAKTEKVEARLVAVCAGRNPALRTGLGFNVRRGSIPLMLSGMWLTNLSREVDNTVAYVANNLSTGAIVGLFPQRGDRARAYFGFHPNGCARLQGDSDFPRFLAECHATAAGAIPFGNPKPDGPLASFECADVWIDHPDAYSRCVVYRPGVSLGCELARTLLRRRPASSRGTGAGDLGQSQSSTPVPASDNWALG